MQFGKLGGVHGGQERAPKTAFRFASPKGSVAVKNETVPSHVARVSSDLGQMIALSQDSFYICKMGILLLV